MFANHLGRSFRTSHLRWTARALVQPPACRAFSRALSSCHETVIGRLANAPASLHDDFNGTHGGSSKILTLLGGATIASVGITVFSKPKVQCDALQPRQIETSRPPPPESIVSVYELSLGTIAGICSGIFIKKGAKAIAFFVGGIFVLLQYFNSMNLVRINWPKVSQQFENLFYTVEQNGARRPPSIRSVWCWLVDFLTADFQPRATFVAGLLLGLRAG